MAGVAHDLRAYFDQFFLERRQRPVLDQLGRRQRAQEVAEVVGEGVKLKARRTALAANVALGSWLCENAFAVSTTASAMAAARWGDHFRGVLIFSSGWRPWGFLGPFQASSGPRRAARGGAATIAVLPPSAA